MPRGRVQADCGKGEVVKREKKNIEILESSTAMVKERRSADGKWRVKPRHLGPSGHDGCLCPALGLSTSDLAILSVNVSGCNSELKQYNFLCRCFCPTFSWEIKMDKFPWRFYVFLQTVFFLPNQSLEVLSYFTLPPSLWKPWLLSLNPSPFHDGDGITSSPGSWSSTWYLHTHIPKFTFSPLVHREKRSS